MLLVAWGLVPLQGLVYAALADPYALVLCQLLDAVSGAIFGVMITVVAADLTRRTGWFNLTLGVLGVAISVGASLSTFSPVCWLPHSVPGWRRWDWRWWGSAACWCYGWGCPKRALRAGAGHCFGVRSAAGSGAGARTVSCAFRDHRRGEKPPCRSIKEATFASTTKRPAPAFRCCSFRVGV